MTAPLQRENLSCLRGKVLSNYPLIGDSQHIAPLHYEIKTATKKKLKELFEQFDLIVSKLTNDINTTALLKMELQTEGPPIASHLMFCH